MRRSLSIVSAVAGVGLLSSLALAGHTEPASAKKAQFTLVNGFLPCDAPNTATQSGNMPACAPAAPAENFNDLCSFSATGSGTLTAVLTGSAPKGNQDLKLAVSAKGLNSFCENLQMCISLTFRATSDDCPEGSCTTQDVNYIIQGGPPICCNVTGGSCKIKTTLFSALPGIFANGKNTGVEILGCGLQAQPPLGPHPPTLSCGVLLK